MLFKGFGLELFKVLAAVLILGTVAADYHDFLRQHYDYPKSSGGNLYCTKKIRGSKCKEVNTFIHDTTNKIKAVCGEDGEDIGNRLRRSKNQFRVTTCKLKGSSTKPPCDYRQNSSPRYIVIGCVNGLPEHYQEGQI